MTSWFDVFNLRPDQMEKLDDIYDRYCQKQLMESVEIVTDLVEKEIERHDGKAENVYLGGFSQGCSLSLATFLMLKDHQLGGVVGLSGMLAMKIKDWEKEIDLELKRKTPIFIYHGESDPMIQWKHAQKTYTLLEKHGLDHQIQTEKGLEHSISLREIEELRGFFGKTMRE